MHSQFAGMALQDQPSEQRPPSSGRIDQLDSLLDHKDPSSVLRGAESVLLRISPAMDPGPVRQGFGLLLDIYQGRHPHYKACNTYFHDLRHATDTFLTTARLLHGAALAGQRWADRDLWIAMVSALFHDAGYIQEIGDDHGSGARYTLTHVRRSMDMVQRLQVELGMEAQDVQRARLLIQLTDINMRASDMEFPSERDAELARLVSTADLLAQTAERNYLEKLLYLYHEFREGGVQGFDSEDDLLRKTPGFFDFLFERLQHLQPDWKDWLDRHFRTGWGLDENLYSVAIRRHHDYLGRIADTDDPRTHLRRGRITRDVAQRYAESG